MHPIEQQAANLPADIRAMATRQAQEWKATVGAIEALAPGDPTAETVLHSAAALLTTITVNYGPRHGWTLRQRRFLYEQSKRLLAQDRWFNAPTWTEQF